MGKQLHLIIQEDRRAGGEWKAWSASRYGAAAAAAAAAAASRY